MERAPAFDGQPIIELNPIVTRSYSATVAQWWFAHECAHHALYPDENSEPAADCYAIRRMRDYGIIYDVRQLYDFHYELQNLQGSEQTGHLPGPRRAQLIAECALS